MKENKDITLILDNGKQIIEYELIKDEETLKKMKQEEERKFQERVKLIEYLEETDTLDEILSRVYGVERITSRTKKDNQTQNGTTIDIYELVTELNYYIGKHRMCSLEPHMFYKEGDDTYKKYHHQVIGKSMFSSISEDCFKYILFYVLTDTEFRISKDWIKSIAEKKICKRIIERIGSKEGLPSPFAKKLTSQRQ